MREGEVLRLLAAGLAPAPLEGGGMPPDPVPVRWEVSEHESFRSGRRGDTVADPRARPML